MVSEIKTILQKLSTHRLIPIATIDHPDKAAILSAILLENSLPVIEILFQTDAACESIKKIRQEHGDMLIGAGTILTPDQAVMAKNAGADFMVSPGFNPRTVGFCIKNNIPIIPGVDSPSLIEAAMDKGITFVKFYPAQASGGIDYLKAIAGPYKDIRIMPTGGITPDNLMNYLSYEKVIACGASWIAPSSALSSNDFETIRRRIRIMTALLEKK